MARSTRFELHIRPMFRELDWRHMLWALDLWRYEDVRDNSAFILSRIESDMPPPDAGGPWPEEWIALFKRWIAEGHPALELGRASYTAVRDAGQIVLTATGQKPNVRTNVWLERSPDPDQPYEFSLMLEPTPPAPGDAPVAFTVSDGFAPPAGVTSVTLVDLDGRHSIPVP